jgi:hypothetical protein
LHDVRLVAPYRWASRDFTPAMTPFRSRFRYRIDTVLLIAATVRKVGPSLLA